MDKLSEYSTFICTECSQEVERGLMRFVDHMQVCTHDAPSMSIDQHNAEVELNKQRAERLRLSELAFSKATAEEKEQWGMLASRTMCGLSVSYVVIGPIIEFEDKMIEKYTHGGENQR